LGIRRYMLRLSLCHAQCFAWKAVATAIYAAIGIAGYLMFGHDVSDEVS
jgi:hypothetical protein